MNTMYYSIYVPFAKDVKLVLVDISTKDEYLIDLEFNNGIWETNLSNIDHLKYFYYYLVNNNFILTDYIKEYRNIDESVPCLNERKLFIQNCTNDINIINVTLSNSIDNENKPVGKTETFTSVDRYAYIIYSFEKQKYDTNIKICLYANNKILTMHDLIISKTKSKMLYVIEFNESLESGFYELVTFNNIKVLNETTFSYKKLVTYNHINRNNSYKCI